MAESQPAPGEGSEAAGNASSGFRRRLGVFLSADALRLIRAGAVAWVASGVGFIAGGLLIITEFSHLSYVTTITATCSDFADPHVRDSCLTVGHESHHYGFALLGLFVILMTFGAAVGGSRPAAVALIVAGLLGLGITLLHDLPNTGKTGEIGVAFARGKAHKGAGFWFELVGSIMATGCGAFLTARTPPRRQLGRRRAAPVEPPADAEEPASA